MTSILNITELPVDYVNSIVSNFKNSFQGDKLTTEVIKILEDYDVKPENTLFGNSVCPDEINEFVTNFRTIFGSKFHLGGLAGFPFTGITGFNAFSSHKPDGGNLFVLYGSHIGINEQGVLGTVQRTGMINETPSCGSAIAAYEQLKKVDKEADEEWDLQQIYVRKVVNGYIDEILASKNQMKMLSELLYQKIEQKIEFIISKNYFDKIILLGGIQINTSLNYHDYFQIKQFKIVNRGKDTAIDCLNVLLQNLF